MSDQRPEPPHSPPPDDTARQQLEQAGATPLQPADPGRIGPYLPLGRLGSGGMGRVYLARPADGGTSRSSAAESGGGAGLAAVKVIRPEYAEDPEFRRRFEREAAVHGRVRTPRAPDLLGAGFEDELLWMSTQYLPGLNLADAVRECGALEAAGAWRLVSELGHALSALATAGVVHRDLKPSNVILTLQGAHVIDFGISRAVDSSAITITGSRVGTPAFMSPEYLRDGRCDTASDVFSLAGTIVYAVTGHAPFGDGTGVDVMHRVAFEEPKPEVMTEVAALDPPLAELLSACLSKDPAGRPTPQWLIDAATTAGHSHASLWQEPLAARLLARQRACQELEHATAWQTGRFRAPTERVASPTPGPGYGPATPPGQYGGTPTPGVYGTPPLPGTFGPATPPASYGQYGPPTPAGGHGAPTPPGGGKRRGKPYLVIAAGVAVCVVAVSAFLFTRPPFGNTTSSGTTVETTAPDGEAASSPPASSASPSPSPGKEDKEREKEEKEEGGKGEETGNGTGGSGEGARPTATVTATAGGGSGGTGTVPSATPTKTATTPATPPWLTQCTYYSGTELTQFGDKNQRVTQVQCMLVKRGYSVGGSGVDGQFGEDTLAAVRVFQSDKALKVDGDVGPNTWAALRSRT
ncbi:protein kinase domain-containing protein [Streptomyces sp. DSM 40750]|uniref:protein kinase domain-containing protein n=1 Tax=Streptomyces sp. DSM 40750 TaxID=2801030 RepID=UPI00214B6178|nr:protein kinase [Streptomyces sp. DSM 40750]UUU24486.1 protein kinase [Streptomyces sp. DSM 40750]